MNPKKTVVSGWGNYPSLEGSILSPANEDEVKQCLSQYPEMIARGNGRSYGDASLGSVMLSTLSLNHLICFDRQTGAIEGEAGMLLHDILSVVLPEGWFFAVTPGSKFITLGGAIAADVHGKNHPSAGCFSQHLLSFRLMDANGEIITCSKTENTALFWQTCGGMGWTGIILSARIQLVRIPSMKMIQETRSGDSVQEILEIFRSNQSYPYAAAWLNGSKSGSGKVFLAKHDETAGAFTGPQSPVFQIPFVSPVNLMGDLNIPVHHWLYNRTHRDGVKSTGLEQYFYPLDAIGYSNRLYGPRGLIQYQFCVSDTMAEPAIRAVLHVIFWSKFLPFLMVLKQHGERPEAAIHSFPEKGFSLAIDFPGKEGLIAFIGRLDQIILEYGGKIYLAKDACSDPRLSRFDPDSFGDKRFISEMRRRLFP